MMSLLIRCYRLLAGYGHCCAPNHVAMCRLAGMLVADHPCRGREHPDR